MAIKNINEVIPVMVDKSEFDNIITNGCPWFTAPVAVCRKGDVILCMEVVKADRGKTFTGRYMIGEVVNSNTSSKMINGYAIITLIVISTVKQTSRDQLQKRYTAYQKTRKMFRKRT